MSRENLERFGSFLAENKERIAKVKSFGSDIDTLAVYAQESGYDISAEEIREYQDKARHLLDSKIKKLQQPDIPLSPGVKDIYNLIKLAESDKDVEKRLAGLSSGTPEELVAYGKEKGFTFSEADIRSVSKNILGQSDELSEEELEMAAGGTAAVILVFLAFAASGAVAVGLVGGMVAFSVLSGSGKG